MDSQVLSFGNPITRFWLKRGKNIRQHQVTLTVTGVKNSGLDAAQAYSLLRRSSRPDAALLSLRHPGFPFHITDLTMFSVVSEWHG
jgi:hypothetical protein